MPRLGDIRSIAAIAIVAVLDRRYGNKPPKLIARERITLPASAVVPEPACLAILTAAGLVVFPKRVPKRHGNPQMKSGACKMQLENTTC